MQWDEHVPANKTHEAKKTIPFNLSISARSGAFPMSPTAKPHRCENTLLAAFQSNEKSQTALHFKTIKEINALAI